MMKMWILSKMGFWKCELCEKWHFQNVNFVKNEILKMWILSKMRLWKCEFLDKLRTFALVCVTHLSRTRHLGGEIWRCLLNVMPPTLRKRHTAVVLKINHFAGSLTLLPASWLLLKCSSSNDDHETYLIAWCDSSGSTSFMQEFWQSLIRDTDAPG